MRNQPYQNLSLKNLNGEVWKDLPKLDSAYQISNYGRVKSKRRFAERSYNGDIGQRKEFSGSVFRFRLLPVEKEELNIEILDIVYNDLKIFSLEHH